VIEHLHAVFASAGLTADPRWCGASLPSIAGLLFVTGLVGGFAHCGPMGGPFVLAQAADAPAAPLLRRLGGGLLLPYHLGRTTTYAALGAAAAGLGGSLVTAGWRSGVAAALLLAGLLYLAQAIVRLAPRLGRGRGEALSRRWAGWLAGIAGRLVADPSARGRFALGVVLGLLPCGFLYAAIAAAAATRSAAAGAVAMAAFSLGTVPSLALVGLGGAAAAGHWRRAAQRLLAPLFLFNGAALTVLAIRLAFAAP
jgi:uncharacterized protein